MGARRRHAKCMRTSAAGSSAALACLQHSQSACIARMAAVLMVVLADGGWWWWAKENAEHRHQARGVRSLRPVACASLRRRMNGIFMENHARTQHHQHQHLLRTMSPPSTAGPHIPRNPRLPEGPNRKRTVKYYGLAPPRHRDARDARRA